ncbi:hypothetical protein SDC9_13384 [bioreactor metagenome]|uniref:Uncharacterized protein n=1 Tax=bioreactor metagenome TaxID=1076179 RepID=A0A644TL56_9ZZZZ
MGRSEAVGLEEIRRLARLSEAVLDTQAAEGGRGLARQGLGHRRAQAADHRMLLHAHHGPAAVRGGQHRLGIEGLYRMHVEHPRLYAPPGQIPGRGQGFLDHEPRGHDADILPLLKQIRLAGDKGAAGSGEGFHHRPGHPDVDRAVYLGGGEDSLAGFGGVAGHENGHVGHHPHQGNVLHALMAAPVLSHRKAGVGKAEFHVGAHVGYGIADLLVGPPGSEEGEGGGEGDEPRMGHAGGRAHHVGLGQAEVEKTLRVFGLEETGHGGVGQVGVQHHYLVVDRAQFDQGFAVGHAQGF